MGHDLECLAQGGSIMRWNRWIRTIGVLPALFLACGCLQLPWVTSQQPGPPTPPRPDAKTPVQAKGPNQTPSPNPIRDRPPELRPVVHEEPASRQAAEVSQKLADVQDENKVLAARLQQYQSQIEEKTRALASARSEVRMVTEEVRQTREQIDHWSREVANLRARAETAEKESQASMQGLFHLVETLISQETAQRGKTTAPLTPAPSVPAPLLP